MTSASDRPRGPARAHPSKHLKGRLRAPGDKSVSHRALILGALAEGETTITGLLEGDDVLATAAAMRALGAQVTRVDDGYWRVSGTAGNLRDPAEPLYFGNSGTGCRLVLGAVAGSGASATFIGDASLSARPMERVLAPLRAMGVRVESTDGHLPVTVFDETDAEHGLLRAIEWTSPVASAQVKSAILLAALGAAGETSVREPALSRDHTERMLRAFGAEVTSTREPDGGVCVRLRGLATLRSASVEVPADPSSAAFLAAAALAAPYSRIELQEVMTNPTRTGFFRMLSTMGANAVAGPELPAGGEAICDWTIEHGPLTPVAPPPDDAAAMIDEYPILAVVAAFANGESRFEGAGELRVKESDRIAATVAMLRANGVDAEELEDGFVVRGRGPGSVKGGGRVETHHDHRIAMSALVLGLGAQEPVEIDDASMIATSYPSFFDQMRELGATMELGA